MIYSGNVLAFVGDAVLTLQVREYLVAKGISNTKELQETSILFVSAKAQANFIQKLIEENYLSETEEKMFRRGRNAKSHSIAKNADVMTYRLSTGFEALWGYLYLDKQHERLEFLWHLFIETVNEHE